MTEDMQPFRTNWWYHLCKTKDKPFGISKWIHKQYMSCSECGAYNGKTNVTRKAL